MPKYSKTDRVLHKLYLGNYSISKAALEMEEIIHGKKAESIRVQEYVFVTGLARSGTTAVMRHIFETGEYASLQYSNMPFILNPNLWKRSSNIDTHERAHKDGILIDGNSPEEFDEYFWKAHLKDLYIKDDGLTMHQIDDDILTKYLRYVKLICLAKGKEKYISKNNNNILRILSLKKIKNCKFIILYRDPISHASSLLKLHKKFSKEHENDPFILEYFNFLGHHEFGLNHKPFILNTDDNYHASKYDRNTINYWLKNWLTYYTYILSILEDKDILIAFEDLINSPNMVYSHIEEKLLIKKKLIISAKHKPGTYQSKDFDEQLLNSCETLYNKLSKFKKYAV